MKLRSVALIPALALSMLLASLAAEAPPPPHVHRIGYLLSTTREQEPFLEVFLEELRKTAARYRAAHRR